MPTAVDARWQRLTKPRRAAVYRAIGRASREARESRDAELAADVRVAIDVLRAHARGTAGSRARSARAPARRGRRTRR